MEIDYSDTQLPWDELSELLARRKKEAEADAKQNRERWQKARNFRFQGGMC
ncbi:MAG: hypothetical protein U0894_11725 [Pirellulales bacterium]